MRVDWGDAERKLTDRVSVLEGGAKGAYPSGNSLLVAGSSETFVIDPSVDVVAKGGVPIPVDAILNSHSHEDHMPGNGFFPNARVHIHQEDLLGARSLEGLMDVFGFPESEMRDAFQKVVVEEFFYTPRPDAEGFTDGAVFDLGEIKIEAVHLPGHTRGHSGFRISDDVFFLSDIDLTGFGPYYGDAWSDLDDFEKSLRRVREEEAAFYVTFHHKGVIKGRDAFVTQVDRFASVIDQRHEAMLEFLSQPRRIDEMIEKRFIYRPHVEIPIVASVERRSAELHVARMLDRGEAEEIEHGLYCTTR